MALSLAVGLALVEGTLRLLCPDLPTSETGMVPHPVWHHWHRADFRFTYHVPGEGTKRQVRFNEHGMRDSQPRRIERPSRVRRVAVLGDSFVEAMQVEEHEGVCKQLEELLSVGVPTEVLNFGCSGFSTSLEYLLLREWVRQWQPDAVLCLHHFSDITEDWRLRARAVGEGETLAAVAPAGSGRGRQVQAVLEYSFLGRLLGQTTRRLRFRPQATPGSLQEGYDAIVHEPYTPQDEEAFAYSLGYLRLMAELLRQEGIAFRVVVVPLGPQVEPVPSEFARQVGLRYLADGRRLEHVGYQRTVTAYCHNHDIAVLDLLAGFRSANPSGVPLLYLPRDQHWTAEGHAVAARLIAPWLEAELATRAQAATDPPPSGD